MEGKTQHIKRLFTIKQFVQEGFYPNEGGVRALVFNAHKNGFNKVIKRINKKIFIDLDAFYKWVDEINQIGGV